MQTRKVTPYLLLVPFVIFFVMFRMVPIIETFITSAFKMSNGQQNFVGFSNIYMMVTDRMFWISIWNTFVMFLMYVLIKMPLIVALSLMINRLKSKKVILYIIYIPTLIGMFAYAIIFRYLFTYNGSINTIIEFIIGSKIDWFGSSMFARLMLVIAVIWAGLGFYVLIYINALKNIPKSYYEIIDLNGGTNIQKLRYLVLPLTKPIISTILFLSALELITMVEIPLNLTQGGPNQSTLTLSYYVYLQAIQYSNFSYAATIGLSIILVGIVIFITRKKQEDIYYEIA